MIGETFNGEFEDGTRFYAEQTAHRPPTTHFMFYGPEDKYIYTGYGNFAAHTGANSIVVNVTGGRKLVFEDGQTVTFNNADVFLIQLTWQEFFDSTFWGTLRHQAKGTLLYEDKGNRIVATINLGAAENK